MKWIRFTLDTHTDAVDMLSYMLDEIGVEGIEIEDHVPLSEEDKKKMFVDILPDPEDNDGTAKVHFYMEPENCNPEKIMMQVQDIFQEVKQFCNIGKGTISLSETEDKDWINNWKTFFKPFRAADNIVIKPTWETYEKENEDDILIEIDPGIAFGTGSHETTKLCIQALDKYVKKGDSVLDVGCGSGILSIAALKLGAAHATAIDIDEVAVKVAAENMEVNHIPASQYTLYDGDLITNSFLKVKAGTGHDIVVANILADVIIPLTGVIRPHLKKGGLYITSGIINTKEEEVREALIANGFEILGVEYMKEWCCFIAK
ncbi:MAG: 50S ribosomal protein L11 methyltransferase [Eubacterium sp.]|nr:50S ribosomal protein L11 methyltransferase [Eubacterium sp.]